MHLPEQWLRQLVSSFCFCFLCNLKTAARALDRDEQVVGVLLLRRTVDKAADEEVASAGNASGSQNSLLVLRGSCQHF